MRLATGLSSRRIRQLLARRDSRLPSLLREGVEPLLELFAMLPVSPSPSEVLEVVERYGLMPADAIITLTCRRYGIGVIAALDRDFEQVPWLRIVL